MNTNRYVKLYNAYSKRISNGDRAKIYRAMIGRGDLRMCPPYYTLLKMCGEKSCPQIKRVISLFPFITHSSNSVESCGKKMYKGKINENRLIPMMEANDNSLAFEYFTYIKKDLKPILNWENFGDKIYYWNKESRISIAEEYWNC